MTSSTLQQQTSFPHNNNSHKRNPPTILWSTQGGRAKACARRTARILRDSLSLQQQEQTQNDGMNDHTNGNTYFGSSFDDYGALEFLKLGGGKGINANVDDFHLVIMFVSTTGDAEQCDDISQTWKQLLQRSLPSDQFQNLQFALFCLGDRAYGPTAFCAAGRKLAARLVQLGSKPYCKIGYGDDGTPNGGVFCDLDKWLEKDFLPQIVGGGVRSSRNSDFVSIPQSPYRVIVPKKNRIGRGDGSSNRKNKRGDNERRLQVHGPNESIKEEWQVYESAYNTFFESLSPATAYQYHPDLGTKSISVGENDDNEEKERESKPLLGCVVSNERITAKNWVQKTKHISIHVCTKYQTKNKQEPSEREKVAASSSPESHDTSSSSPPLPPLPYMAGDIATILPSNDETIVKKFISCLPQSIQKMADTPINIETLMTPSTQYKTSFTSWPKVGTLRGILTSCADIASLPEREDLRALSVYCNLSHPMGTDQRSKLISLSETRDAALYGDYIIREKRNWGDVLFDFDSIQFEGDTGSHHHDGIDVQKYVALNIEHLLLILPPIRPRHFSIASAPSLGIANGDTSNGYSLRHGRFGFSIDLCVAIVEGETPHGRKFKGLCSDYLSQVLPSSTLTLRLWIRPGSFQKLPLKCITNPQTKLTTFEIPVVCVGAGTGIAPIRSILLERKSTRQIVNMSLTKTATLGTDVSPTPTAEGALENILFFGCRKQTADYYYKSEWEDLVEKKELRILNAFSQGQQHKIYVQKLLRDEESGHFITKHIIENDGAVYIAGGAKMARAVKDEIVESLAKVLDGGIADAKRILKHLQRMGKFNVEAWS